MSAFFAVPVAVLQVDRVVPFAVYTHVHDQFLLYQAEESCYTSGSKATLASSGVEFVWASAPSLPAYLTYVAESLKDMAGAGSHSPLAQLRCCYRAGVSTTEHALRAPEFEPTIIALEHVVTVLLETMSQHGFTFTALRSLMEGSQSLFSHSVNVCLYGVLLGNRIEYPKLHDLAMALLFHDVGKLDLPQGLFETTEPLTEEERTEVETHPELGIKRVRSVARLSPLVRDVIQNHHERMDGRGYPRGIPGRLLSEPTRIAALANTFANRTSGAPDRRARSSFEVLSEMATTESSAYDRPLLTQFVQMLSS